MLSIEWQTSYCSGIPLLDTQNKQFIETLNLLFEYQDNDPDHGFLCQMLWKIVAYAHEHFRQEELFLEQFDPDELAEHRQQHFLFQENLTRFCRNVTRDGLDAAVELNQYVRDWVVFHIAHVDKSIARSIKNSAHT
jgi:hemerythrin-like metal-binding protein